MGEWIIGAFINLFGSIAINFGTNLLKLGHDEVIFSPFCGVLFLCFLPTTFFIALAIHGKFHLCSSFLFVLSMTHQCIIGERPRMT